MTVYADILFLVNFSMDFLTLYLTGRILHKKLRKSHLITAAIFGSAVGTAYSLVFDITGAAGTVVTIITGLLISCVMVRISFGKSASRVSLIRDSLSVWGAGTLLGGIMTFVLSLGEPVYIKKDNNFLPAFAACFFVSIGLTRLFSASKPKSSASVTVESAGISHTFEALCDSGNFAVEPISGLPVIIVRKTAVGELSEMLAEEPCMLRLRMIPLHGLGGDCLLRGFLPDRITVNEREVSAVIAVQENTSTFAGFDGIIPASLCKNLQ